VTKSVDQPVILETTEEQKLRLQLAQRDCELNLSRRCGMESEIGLFQTQKRLHEFALRVIEENMPWMQKELARLEREAAQLTRAFFEVGEHIKTENGWSDRVQLDVATLTYSAPAEDGWTAVPVETGENKVLIH
jgi:hypothetical protein